jgi:hypothetical protein
MIKALFISALLLIGTHASFATDELRLIISPKSALLGTEGRVDFDAYVYNTSKQRLEVPAPQGLFNVVWTLRDLCKNRPDRDGSHFVVGTDTIKKYVINPGTAVTCELSDEFSAEPADMLEFYITLDRKLKSGAVETIRSNSIILYRP